jgi:acyl-CoA thioesterase-1
MTESCSVLFARRRRLPIIVWLVCLLALPPAASAADQRLLIIGDSLSDAYNMPRESGWAYLLEQRLGQEWRVINAAISGETTAGAAYRVPELLARHEPSHVLIILGGNDGLRALSPAQIRDNLQLIIERSKSSGAAVALMQVRLPASLGPVYLRRFEALYPALADTHGIVLIPFFLETLFDQPGMLLNDGIHPSPAAQAPMLEAIWGDLGPFLQGKGSGRER